MTRNSPARVTDKPLRTGYKKPDPEPKPPAKVGRYEAPLLVSRFGSLVAIAAVVNQYVDDWAEGFATSTGGPPGGRGGVSRPTENAVIAPDRPCKECGGDTPCWKHPQPGDNQVWARRSGEGLASDAAEIVEIVEQIGELTRRGLRLVTRIAPLEDSIAKELAEQKKAHKLGAGACQCCAEPVTGVGNDRLRSGYCDACRKAWDRAGRPAERHLFEARRRAELAPIRGDAVGDDETAGASTNPDDGVLLAATDPEVRPHESGPYCEHIPPDHVDPDDFRCPFCNTVEVAS